MHNKYRRGRAAALNMVITETGAGKAVTKALPSFEGKLTSSAIRVPVPNGSLAILNLELEKETNKDYSQEDILEEESLFSGGFPSYGDKLIMKKFHSLDWDKKKLILDDFEDKRYSYLGKKIIYDYDPKLLNKDDEEFIAKIISSRHASTNTEKWLTIPEAFAAIDDLREKYMEDEKNLEILDDYNSHLEKMLTGYQSATLTYDD